MTIFHTFLNYFKACPKTQKKRKDKQAKEIPNKITELLRITNNNAVLLQQIQQILSSAYHLQLISALHPQLINLFKPDLHLRDNDLQYLKGLYCSEDENKTLASHFAAEAEKVLWRAHSQSIADGIQSFEHMLSIPSYSKHYQLASFINYLNYLTDDDRCIVRLGEQLESHSAAWSPGFEDAWLKYILSLLETSDPDNARRVLERYHDVYGKHKLECFLPVAHFAHSCGYRSNALTLASACFEQLKSNEQKCLIENFVSGKSIAVVGNGPYELGKSRGSEIDRHDIVIRFGVHQLEKFRADYGSKCSINMLHTSRSFEKVDIKQLALANIVLFIDPLRFDNYTEQILTRLSELFKLNKNICTLPMDVLLSCRRAINYNYPTAGMKMLFWLHHLKANLPRGSIYGFLFNNMDCKDDSYHYFETGTTPKNNPHDFLYEAKMLNELIP